MTNQTNFADSILNSVFEGVQVNDVNNIDQVSEILDRYGLRWTVSKQPLLLETGEDTGFFGIVRSDTKQVFSTCKDTYTPFQNSELAELLIRISEKTGFELHSGGAFNGGGKVYIQLNTKNSIKGIGNIENDEVKGYVTGINSHDGTTSLKWGAVTFTVSCRNTFALANKKLKNSARHTTSMHAKVDASIREILGITEQENTLFENFIRLSEIEVKPTNIARIVNDITGVDINLKKTEAQDKYSTYAINRTNELLGSISREMTQKGSTLWGLLSGVTHYTSHVLPVPNRENSRLESKYTGTGLNLDNEAYNTILSFAQ